MLKDRCQCRLHMCALEQVPQPDQMGKPLADQVVRQAPLAILVFGRQFGLELLGIVLAIVEHGFHPLAAALVHGPVLGRRPGVPHMAGHFLRRAQGAQIEGPHHGVGAVELDVVGVVLDPCHHAVAVGVPL